jgi:hypothetical protein
MKRRLKIPRPRIVGTGARGYVICPKCGDPVAEPFKMELTCVHCKEKFPFDKSAAVWGVISLDENKGRWIVG